MSESFLRSAITEALPDLPEVSKDILQETLQSLGIETHDDFQFVKEEDLLSALRPIQARKLVAAWSLKCQAQESASSSLTASPGPYPSVMCESPISTSSSSSGQSPQGSFPDSFVIPWRKFPEDLTQALERGKRPGPSLRKEMVRIVVREMMKVTTSLCKRNAVDVARKLVAKYPKSLQDVIEGDIIGTGYYSLVKQIQNRIENVKRPTTPKIKRRPHDSDTDEIPPEKRAAIQDTYGCIRWHVKFLPLGETADSQQQKKDELKNLFSQNEQSPGPVKMLMKSTFYTQRQEVNQGKDVKYLLENWPYWFCEIGMAVHFNELTGVDLKETFLKNMEQKGERLLHFMKTVAVNKSKRFYQAATKLQMMRGEHPGYTHATEMVLLLLAYFDEKEDVMFHYVEDTCLAGEVDLNSVPLTPTIVVCGQSCYSSGRMMLSVDQVIVNENISSFISALCMMFGSYYCFNIHYPSTLASTLEFLQRCFFSINPEKGTKVEQTKTKRLHVNPRVLTLIQDLSDHEWRAI
ncbi:uncharacterized protein LOC118557809 isoform X2 [Fundulus heteroclitus]|uniref:uncharacterized protein LOC118556749 isoform X1 n=1 Tax=Fundulus heteroclitus TaxID=8078 RepID=UPI00165B7003|nr:uncharacterized protein LOC118556749 isoform X1 [Fundulus heteroclitus]XP_035980887.1 uncharacterized protein LOC118556749 isoform X1 [Fundulus heteroclitus]XP_035980888.1 uncharacterized protein LOC118556749 isoform X1 [Fundulus heteroclitus]XP_035980889.1 uncharacterized protein LOC118556749 isoform X1 [Fundulus heteroclitus]XP_035980890.1 uncharacterized protein LOC118556749 isoform X1 [Fundulus heteroclitus]XP_035980891.1 uncharacterized protein LOC118556749 isoform X1 [Fundulus heteroc